nr:DUF3068 domain-containing protein [Allobranchiibius sp. GilTou38]
MSAPATEVLVRKSAIVIGFGAFFLTLALLLQFYAFDKLTVIPADTNTQQVLSDNNAKFFDADTLSFKQGTVTTRQTVVADKKASDAEGKNSIVLDINQSTDNNNQAPPIDAFTSHFALNRHTGKVIDCCNDNMNGKPVQHQGYTVKFPFGAGKGSYPYWDNTLQKPMTMTYAGTDKIRGLSVYRYHGVVPQTTYTKQAIPGFVFGGAKDSPGVNADRAYANDRTIWVEPQTGAFIKVEEKEVVTLTDPANGKSVKGIDTDQVMNDATVKANVDEYKGKASQLKLLKLMPWVLGVLGLILLVVGIVLLLIGGRGDRAERADDTEVDNDNRRGARHAEGDGDDYARA